MQHHELLRKHNLKATPQRLEIVSVLAHKGHMGTSEMYEHLRKKFPSISLATVYKNINIMLEKGFLFEVKLPEKKNVFELVKEKHSHVVCSKCSSIIDIELDVHEVVEQVKELTHYKIESNSLVFNGLCPRCSALK
jgi:Fur family transcriptional regulator, peroxide stress response regulator